MATGLDVLIPKHGELHEFRPDSEELSAYLERVDIYFAVNDVSNDKKVSVLLNAIGGQTYGVLRSLCAHESPASKTYAQITEKLREHYQPKVNIIAERFHFHKRAQLASESVAEYIAELCRMAARCSFEAYLYQALRDRFVCGLRSESTQKCLLTERDLTLASAVDKAKEMEAAHKDAQTLMKNSVLAVGKLEGRSSRNLRRRTHSEQTCHRCGNKGHTGQTCPYRDTECHKCKKKGHFARMCRKGRSCGARKTTNWVEEEPTHVQPSDRKPLDSNPLATEDHLCEVHSLEAPGDKPYKVVLMLDGKPVKMEIDTGAAVSIISHQSLKNTFPNAILHKPTIRLRTYTSEPIAVVGQLRVEVKHNGYVGQHHLYVVEGDGPTLIGRDWLTKLKLDWASVKTLSRTETKSGLDELLEKFPRVFQPGLGAMSEFKAHLTVKPEARPRFCRPRFLMLSES